jgi:hypothetical protein
VRYIAGQFAQRFGVEPLFDKDETRTALLNNAAKAHRLFGYPRVTPQEMIEWVASWIVRGQPTLNKPTHFDVRDGKF